MHFLHNALMLIGRYDRDFNARLERTFKHFSARVFVLFSIAAAIALISEFLTGNFILFYSYLAVQFLFDLCGIYHARKTGS